MVSLLTYVLRALGESNDSYGDALASSSLRILQDCPANVIGARRVNQRRTLHFRCLLTTVEQELMLALRHLVLSHHKLALLPHIDKLSDERVLLGTGVGSRELLRFVLCSLTVLGVKRTLSLVILPTPYSRMSCTSSGMISHLRKLHTPLRSIRESFTMPTSQPASILCLPR